MSNVKKNVFSGSFYPDDADKLKELIDGYLQDLKPTGKPCAYLVPHAGYAYSGLTAGYAFGQIKQLKEIKTIFLFGPSHRHIFQGVTLPDFSSFETPLGNIEVSRDQIDFWGQKREIEIQNETFQDEHCLEVLFPFIKIVQPNVKIVPVLCSTHSETVLVKMMDEIMKEESHLMLFSSDLSHYRTQEEAIRLDINTLNHIEDAKFLDDPDSACGRMILNAFSQCEQRFTCRTQLLDYRTSGDTAGDMSAVVGYAAMEIYRI